MINSLYSIFSLWDASVVGQKDCEGIPPGEVFLKGENDDG
jgi:hypothetical protein